MTRWARAGPANKKKPLEATGWGAMISTKGSPSETIRIKQDKIKDQINKRKKLKQREKNKTQDTDSSSQASLKFDPESLGQYDCSLPAEMNTKNQKDDLDVRRVQLLEQVRRKDERRENRRVKRADDRQKMRVCYNCRESGHDMSTCPQVRNDVEQGSGICFKCGSTEHMVAQCRANVPHGKFPFAKCFICNEVGHLSRNCPDNPRGLYPNGGCCRICESVEHFKKDCPELQKQQGIQDMSLPTMIQGTSLDHDELLSVKQTNNKRTKTKHKVVKF